MRVGQVMSRSFGSLHEGDSVDEALRRMKQLKVAALPVIGNGGGWKGLATRADLEAVDDGARSVGALARADLSLSPNDQVEAALTRLIKQQRGRLPVVEGGMVVGTLNRAQARDAL